MEFLGNLGPLCQGGMVEYWRGPKGDYEVPKNVAFQSKLDTDLYEFAKHKTFPLSMTISRDGKFLATFGEDKKILKLFQNKRDGRYLDLGCFHPIRQNNTFLFYKLGWKGINIDLNPLTIELFNIARPDDINICAAISGKKDLKIFFLIMI